MFCLLLFAFIFFCRNAATDNDEEALPEEYLRSTLAKESQVSVIVVVFMVPLIETFNQQKPPSNRDAELQEQEELEMAMAISLSTSEQPKPSTQTRPPPQTQPPRAPVQVTDDLPMYNDIPSAPTYDPLPEPEYSNPQVSWQTFYCAINL